MCAMRFRHACLSTCLLLVLTAGCQPLLSTPPSFLQLEEDSDSWYGYRATSADGVVIAVREVDVDPDRGGSLQFWVDATTLKMRDLGGYALLEQADVKSHTGLAGKQLRFGRDEKGKPYRYWLTLFLTDDALYVVEAGGPQERFDAHRETVAKAILSLQD